MRTPSKTNPNRQCSGIGRWSPGAALLLVVATDALSATLVRGPYLQLATRSSVTVVWNTDVPAVCSVALELPGGSSTAVQGSPGTTCVVTLDGLTPGTRYAYVPRADGAPLTQQTTFSLPEASDAFSFLVVGDSGSGGAGQLRVRDRMLATPASFALHTGDMIYEDGAAKDFDRKYFVPYRTLLRRLVLWPCLGNHDVVTANGAPWRDAFLTPANNADGDEGYYSFDAGNAHFVMVDTNRSTSPGSRQHAFLIQDLAASTATWKLVAFHHSIYSSGLHGSNARIRANLAPLFDQHEVDVVLMGHDHHYERALPLRGDVVVAPGMGTTYITTGGGGAELYPVEAEPFTAYAESVFHYVRIRVDGTTLLAQMIRDDGTIGDSVTLVKGEPPPAARCGDGLVNQPTEHCDGDDRPACVGACRTGCTCAPACGDGVVNQASEACEASDDSACPGRCVSGCRCTDPALLMSVEASGDTHVEAGAQASWDHGAAARVEADGDPQTFAYLKFDLSAVPRFVTGARLAVRCVNASVNDATIYPVADSTWIEGTETGLDATSAAGPGLKWTDLDTNGDGNLDASDTSPYVPAFAHWLGPIPCTLGETATADVTPALAPDATIVSLAIGTDSSDAAHYASREVVAATDRPHLLLQLGGLKPTTTTTSSSSTSTTVETSTTTTAVSSSTTSITEPTSTTATTLETSTTMSSVTSSTTTTTNPTPTTSTTFDGPTTTSSTSSTTSTTEPTSNTATTLETSTTTSSTSSTTVVPPTTTTSLTSSTSITTTTSSTTTTAPPRPLCIAGGCDDGDECTDDRCVSDTGCVHDPVEGFPAVACRFSGLMRPPACEARLVPPALGRAIVRARTLVDRAAEASSARRAKARLRKAIRALARAGRIVRRQRTLPTDCAAVLAANLEDVRSKAERLARSL
jgi:hypothetical protein